MKDIHATITDRFLEQLRAGYVPWQRPWRSVQNIISRKAYRGINSLTLGSTQFGSPFWMTFRQAHEMGGKIRKGERSTPVIYHKFLQKRDANGNPLFRSNGKPAQIPFIRWSNVFNLEQTEGVQTPELPPVPETMPALTRAEVLVNNAKLCPIRKEGFAATYSPTEDIIRVPPSGIFRSSEDYYHTLFHEMTHATGHASRLDREGITNPIKFGSERYSKEELIAELGAAFLSNEAGILDEVRFDNSAAYLQSWIKKFEDDRTLLVSAASHAQRSFDWVTGRTPDQNESLGEELPPILAPVPSASEELAAASAIPPLHDTHSPHSPQASQQEQRRGTNLFSHSSPRRLPGALAGKTRAPAGHRAQRRR